MAHKICGRAVGNQADVPCIRDDGHRGMCSAVRSNNLEIAGWELAHTGGNCTALQRATRGGEWLITDGESSAPTAPDAPVMLTYDGPKVPEPLSMVYPDTRAALVAVAAAEGRAVGVIERAVAYLLDAQDREETTPEDDQLLAELRGLIGAGVVEHWNPKIGDRVYWTDPDEDLCSGAGVITAVLPNGYAVTKDAGGDVDVLRREIRRG